MGGSNERVESYRVVELYVFLPRAEPEISCVWIEVEPRSEEYFSVNGILHSGSPTQGIIHVFFQLTADENFIRWLETNPGNQPKGQALTFCANEFGLCDIGNVCPN